MTRQLAVLVAAIALCTSCQKFAEGKEMFRELLTLRDQVATEFHEKVVDVNLTKANEMTVKFMNSPLQSASREAKQNRADEVAAFVASHYKHPLAKISTTFAIGAGARHVEETFVGKNRRQEP